MIGYLKLWFPLYSEYMDLVPAVLRVYGFDFLCTPEYMDLIPAVLPIIWIWFPLYSRVYGFDSRCTPSIWIWFSLYSEYMDLVLDVLRV